MKFAKRLDNVSGSAIRAIFALLEQPGMISFAGGNPAPDCFPNDDVADIAHKLLHKNGSAVLQYGGTPGAAKLKDVVIDMAKQRGIAATPEQVIITSGSTQGIGLAAKSLINPGDVILAESPTFIGALQTFLTYEADVKGVKMDEHGMDIDALEAAIIAHNPKFVYTIPTFQNPTGRTMSIERRAKMVQVCEKHGVLILEDDPYCDLRYSGDPVPPIKSFDKTDNVIYLMSFSKIISPGLRVGAAIADPRVIAKYNVCKQGEDLHTSNLSQEIVTAYVNSGKLHKHIAKINAVYKAKRDAMLAKLKSFPDSIKYTVPDGGLFIWLDLPNGADAMPIFENAVERGVAFVPGTHFYPDGSGKSTMRLNFSMASLSQIDEGMDILKAVVQENM
ncbi:MAG: PLP-dependent aminotransferase family protein [Clostridia bacterium]|jgi:2-aminoadipate transaminase|nr:PLP-dependent aminotransferase family protein [Clostridia bacterium]MBT7123096.1 PLP-dependent aminotransferase family protein [Clostridia bacterium]